MRLLVVIIGLLVLNGCVDVERIKKQTLVVRTPHVTDAKCELVDKRGTRWVVRKSPGTVTVRAGNAPLNVTCAKKGYEKTIISVEEERVDMQNYPGFLEEVSGFVQDPYSNIITHYPDEIQVWMRPDKWGSEDDMRAWVYEKDIYDKQQEAKRLARLEEERKMKIYALELKEKYAERLNQQREHLANSKWFRWLNDKNADKYREKSLYNLEEHIDDKTKEAEKPKPATEPINWQSDEERLRQKMNPNEEGAPWKFWESDWFKGLTSFDKRRMKEYPNSHY